MNLTDGLILFCVSLVSSLSQVLFKKGALLLVLDRGFLTLLKTGLNPYLVAGGTVIVGTPLLYIYVLQRTELVVAFAFTALNYVCVLCVAHVFFHESVSARQWYGVVLVMLGIVLTTL